MKYEPQNAHSSPPTHATHSIRASQQTRTHDRRTRAWVHGDVELHPSIYPPFIHPAREVRDKAVPSSNQGRPGREGGTGKKAKAARQQHWRGQPNEGNEASVSRTHQEKASRTGQGKNGAPNPNCQALLFTLRICYVVLCVWVCVGCVLFVCICVSWWCLPLSCCR
jgi:hypothetical protein